MFLNSDEKARKGFDRKSANPTEKGKPLRGWVGVLKTELYFCMTSFPFQETLNMGPLDLHQ